MPYDVDWLTGALTRNMLESFAQNDSVRFLALDVKRSKENKFSDGDKNILAAILTLRDAFSKINHALYRIGGDEFVLIADFDQQTFKTALRKIQRHFYTALEKKLPHESWSEAFDKAYEVIKKKKSEDRSQKKGQKKKA